MDDINHNTRAPGIPYDIDMIFQSLTKWSSIRYVLYISSHLTISLFHTWYIMLCYVILCRIHASNCVLCNCIAYLFSCNLWSHIILAISNLLYYVFNLNLLYYLLVDVYFCQCIHCSTLIECKLFMKRKLLCT